MLEEPGGERFDIMFAVMQYRQMERIVSELAAIDSPIVVLTGNNLTAHEMEARIHAESSAPKTVLFGFGSTAGTRENGRLTTVHVGDGRLTLGRIDAEVPADVKTVLTQAFSGSRLSVAYCDNMDAWLKYHAAFILPVVYLCYKTGCDLKKSARADRKLMLDAVKDACRLLMALDLPARPAAIEKLLEPGFARMAMKLIVCLAANTRLGALCTTEHCRHAPREMEDLDEAFQRLRTKKPDLPMPAFDHLHGQMPSWERIRVAYANRPSSGANT